MTMERKGNDRMDERSPWEALAFVSGIGLNFVALIAICIFLGKKADAYFAIAPWGTIGGVILGFLTGIYATYKKILGKT